MMPCTHAGKGEMYFGNNQKNSSIERKGGLGKTVYLLEEYLLNILTNIVTGFYMAIFGKFERHII